jgi:hypothetical protein
MFSDRFTTLSPLSDRDDLEVRDVELGRERREVGLDLVVDGLVVVDEVHLVHGEHQVRYEQREDDRVPAGLLSEPLPGVDEHEPEVGGGGAGDHVAGVLHVAGRVRDEELPRRREVAVGHVDRDALLALGAQAVGQQGQVGVVVAARLRGRLDGLELVLEDPLGVEQQATDEGGLAVVDRPCSGESQQVHQK